MEIGRIYLDNPKKLRFIFKCRRCHRTFHQWKLFENHVQARHIDLESFENLSIRTMEFSNENGQKAYKKHKLINDKLEETEVVLIADDNGYFEEQLESKVDSKKLKVVKEKEVLHNDGVLSSLDITPLQTANLHLDFDQLDDTAYTIVVEPDFDTTNEVLDQESNTEASDIEQALTAAPTIHSTDRVKMKTKQPRIFYSLRDTDPKIMLHFIKLINKYPCHWDVNDSYYGTRNKRHESATYISNELNERWNLTTTIQIILASITSILRWYEREYTRLQESNAEPTSHIKYYAALTKFLLPDYVNNYNCNECERVFKTNNQLLTHKHLLHNAEVPFKCAHCDRTFAYESLKRHHENRHTLKEYFPCTKCKYRAPNKTDLQLHMTTHTNVRSFICDVCAASYKSSTSLNVHKRTHSTPRFKCERCGKAFFENYRFKCHMKLHAMRNTPLKCKICKIEFPTRFAVKEHLKEHDLHGYSDHFEELNDATEEFFDDNDLYDEIFLNTDKNNETLDDYDGNSMELIELACSYCSSEFINAEDLEVHIIQAHNIIS